MSKGSWTSEQGQKIEGTVEEFVFIELQLRAMRNEKIAKWRIDRGFDRLEILRFVRDDSVSRLLDYKSSELSRGRGRR